MTKAEHERLAKHEQLLNSVQSTERAYLDAVAVAKAADKFAAEAANAAQAAAWNLEQARKHFDAHKSKMSRES